MSKLNPRQQANMEILNFLNEEILCQPDIRFGQLLRNLGIIREALDDKGTPTYWVNEFNTEPYDMLARIEEYYERQNRPDL